MIKNYIAHLNGYKGKRKFEPLTSNEIALYWILFEYCNELCFMDWFTAPNSTLEGLSGLSKPAFKRARAELTRKGYIKYREGCGNQAGRYLMVDFEPQCEPQAIHKVIPLNKHKNKVKRDTLLHEVGTPCNSVIEIILNDKTYHAVAKEQVDRWHELYPAVDIMGQLRAMAGWCEANNTKRKTKSGINKFINSWLAREQNKGGTIYERKQERKTLNG